MFASETLTPPAGRSLWCEAEVTVARPTMSVPGTPPTGQLGQLQRDERTFIEGSEGECLLRLVGCLPRRNGAAARAAGVRQASKEETAEHRADAAAVMGIVALASGAEPPSRTGSGVGELAVKAAASPADDPLGVPTARMGMHRDHRTGQNSERPCTGCSTRHQQHEGHGRAGEWS